MVMTQAVAVAPPAPASAAHPTAAAWGIGAAAAVVTALGSWIPSYWGDEAASVMSAQRSLPSLTEELSTVDAVHGLYYYVLHFWGGLFGFSEFSTRLPSAIAVAAMVAGTVILGSKLGGTRLGVIAGIVALVLPRTTYMGAEARSYAFSAAAAVWLTVLLIELLSRRTVSVRAWMLYGVAVAASVYLFLYLYLLLVVHGAYLLIARRQAVRAWLSGAIVATVLALPILLLAYSQRDQISFLADPRYATFINVVVIQWFSGPVAVAAWTLILVLLVAVIARARRSARSVALRSPELRSTLRDDTSAVLLALLWLVLPTAIILLANATIAPLYNIRYFSFSTPAAALLIAGGIAVVARWTGAVAERRGGPGWSARTELAAAGGLVLALAVIAAPTYLAQRTPFSKDGGSDLRQSAAYLGEHARPGDAIIFDQNTKAHQDPRLALHLYPTDFVGLNDVALVTPFYNTSGLWDVVSPNTEVLPVILESPDVWAMELQQGSVTPSDVTFLEAHGFRTVSSERINRTVIYHLIREPS